MKQKIGYLKPEAYFYIRCKCGRDIVVGEEQLTTACENCGRVYERVDDMNWNYTGKFYCENCGQWVDKVYPVKISERELWCKDCIDETTDSFRSDIEQLHTMIDLLENVMGEKNGKL